MQRDFKDKCQDPNGCQQNCIDQCLFLQLISKQPKEKNGSPEFYELLKQMEDIHSRKNYDYAQVNNPFSNFERAGALASWFANPYDKAFVILIGVKLARLAELSNGKIPNNENINDTHIDLANYCTLWAAYRKTQAIKNDF